MLGPFPVSEVIARLEAQARAVIFQVGSAADLATALAQEPRVDCAAFVTIAERGRGIHTSGSVARANVDVTLRVVLFVRHVGSAADGSAARVEMDTNVLPAVRGALFGWSPADAFDSLQFQASRDESYKPGWLVCQEIYTTDYAMQKVSP